ncbi:hypothetical protein [Caminicella sporogenes]|uniref:hypothetical protein n=1 Tax=Caminicella sporogenes TaxID=166485 RepID=UPI0025415C02|nr:hypothetical protein [Caminicella sporogenes]WIF94623.1 hypothetical protein QNI18_10200 [Caminicella sporogenes]
MNINLYNFIYNGIINNKNISNENISNVLKALFISDINIGDVFRGKILKISDNLLNIEVNSKFIFQAKNISNENNDYKIGKTLEFTVVGKNEDKNEILIKINDNLDDKSIDDDTCKFFTDKMTDKIVIEKLLKNEIPVTKENIELIKFTQKYYGKLAEILKQYGISIDEGDLKIEIKELLKKVVNNLNFSEKDIADENKENYDEHSLLEKFKGHNKSHFLNSNDLLKLMNNISQDKLVFMLKNSLKFNLMNIKLIDEIIVGKKDISNKLLEFIEILKENGIKSEEYSNLVKLIKSVKPNIFYDKSKINEIMNKIYFEIEKLEYALNEKENNTLKTIIARKIEDIKTSFKFLNKLNENLTFIQIPINVNENIHSLEIYISKEAKKNKKINKKSTKIFISLDTKNLNIVQSLIEINNKEINLNFKLNNNKIESFFKNYENELINSLYNLDFKKVNIKYTIVKEKDSLIDIISSDKMVSKYNKLDLRV